MDLALLFSFQIVLATSYEYHIIEIYKGHFKGDSRPKFEKFFFAARTVPLTRSREFPHDDFANAHSIIFIDIFHILVESQSEVTKRFIDVCRRDKPGLGLFGHKAGVVDVEQSTPFRTGMSSDDFKRDVFI